MRLVGEAHCRRINKHDERRQTHNLLGGGQKGRGEVEDSVSQLVFKRTTCFRKLLEERSEGRSSSSRSEHGAGWRLDDASGLRYGDVKGF